jgi:hypothetical protein
MGNILMTRIYSSVTTVSENFALLSRSFEKVHFSWGWGEDFSSSGATYRIQPSLIIEQRQLNMYLSKLLEMLLCMSSDKTRLSLMTNEKTKRVT